MAIHFHFVVFKTKKILNRNQNVKVPPKGYIPVYIGDEADNKKKFMVPLSYLSHPAFQNLLQRAEEEFGFHHPLGCLTIPCSQQIFFKLFSELKCLRFQSNKNDLR